MIGYSLQLYFDFSGYSSMAVGLGYMFGIRIPQNFNSPYRALDPSDFWRRWHISLSSCLRDYVYIPLGGSRRGSSLTYRNLFLTMLIGGLWHGASWTFVFWGAYHGMLLGAYRMYASRWDALPNGVRRFAMFVLVLVGWVFFRATDFGMAASILTTMFVPHGGAFGTEPLLGTLLVAGAAWWSIAGPNAFEMDHVLTARRRVVLTALFASCVAIIAGAHPSPFLYFQF